MTRCFELTSPLMPGRPTAARVAEVSAKNRRKPRNSNSSPTSVSKRMSSERYDQPKLASCVVNVDLPLPEAPAIIVVDFDSSETTPALWISKTPDRLRAGARACESNCTKAVDERSYVLAIQKSTFEFVPKTIRASSNFK